MGLLIKPKVWTVKQMLGYWIIWGVVITWAIVTSRRGLAFSVGIGVVVGTIAWALEWRRQKGRARFADLPPPPNRMP